MSRIVTFDTLGSPDVLQIVDREVPPPEAGEVQVEMRVAGLNRAELLFIAGAYLAQPDLPGARVGVEGSGIVRAIGSDVEGVALGDRVSVLPSLDMARHGVMAEIANLPVAALVPIPDGKDFPDAAALWMAHGTAVGMMQMGGLREGAGQTVLITGASSSVGLAAFQVAKAHGATSIATTRGPSKVQALRDAGADHVIVTDEEDLVARVTEITNGRGVDMVCDAIGGPMVETLAEATADEGTMVLMGLQSGELPPMPFYAALSRGISVTGYHLVFRSLAHPDRRAAMVDHVTRGWTEGRYKPVIDRTFDLDHVADAYRHMASNTQIGKIVVEIG